MKQLICTQKNRKDNNNKVTMYEHISEVMMNVNDF